MFQLHPQQLLIGNHSPRLIADAPLSFQRNQGVTSENSSEIK